MVRGRGILCLVLSGCGRLGYDSVAGEAGGVDAGAVPFAAASAVVELDLPEVSEEDPSLTADMLEIVFAGNRDLMVARRPSAAAAWGAPEPVAELNTAESETAPEISADGLTIYFTSFRGGGAGGGDIYIARRSSRADPWSAPASVAELDSAAFDVDAFEVPGGSELFLVSDRAGGAGGQDIYLADREVDAIAWNPPVEIDELNTADVELASYLHEPTQTLYFASDRDGDALDLYFASRPSPGAPFGSAQPIAELNTADRESDPWLSADGRVLFFSASIGDGLSAIYFATR